MSESDRVFADLIAANPVPRDSAPHPQALTEGALLDVIDARSASIPQSTTRPADRPPAPPQGKGWLVAAAAFVVVLLTVGVIAAVALNGGDKEIVDTPTTTQAPPTTQTPTTTEAPSTTQAATTTGPPTTTTKAPAVDPGDQAVIDDFVTTFNSGDPDATLAVLAPDALMWATHIAGNADSISVAEFGPLIEGWLRFSALQETQIALDSCTVIDGDRIRCRGSFSDAIVEASPLSAASLSATFEVDQEGRVSYASLRTNDAEMNAAYGYFLFWLNEVYPNDDGILFGGGGSPSFNDEALALWATRVPEWIATLDD